VEDEVGLNLTIFGKKLYQQRARVALPILVRQAKASQTLYYHDLAIEVSMSNPRNLYYVLGAIGNELLMLGKKWSDKIPPIQCLVINKSSELPGEGISWFIENSDEFKQSSTKQKKEIIKQMLSEVFLFDKWDQVLEELDLQPLKNDAGPILSTKSNRKAGKYGAGGESEDHRELKEYIAKNPTSLKLSEKLSPGEIEFEFPSADTVDILFKDKVLWIGVEVKSDRSNEADILRGLFQCVKYRALIEATQGYSNIRANSRIILALGGAFPKKLLGLKHQLGIEVIDKITL
jgi:hypothetical protein